MSITNNPIEFARRLCAREDELFERTKRAMVIELIEHAEAVEGENARLNARLAAVTTALHDACRWHRLGEAGGSNEAVRAIYGQETLDELLGWERVLAGEERRTGERPGE